ncbi:biotin/lipoyl-containing protein [Alistipes timonensis]|uniref:biotin/lipoyl-containing protein n=1 Tax=Alistipes timonensis TaxID=1465754 RepID=UPI0024332327|nr:biotin/lipoyl-containing protein [Alistipes timonensis]
MKKKLFFIPFVATCGISFAQPPFSQIHERNFGNQTTVVGNYVELSAINKKRETEVTYIVTSCITGKVAKIWVSVGDFVDPGLSLITIEAMKVDNILGAEVKGQVIEILVKPGQSVNVGDILMKVRRTF